MGKLLLEDGRCFEGISYGAQCTKLGEVVFNTSMTGYQEVLTDPSYLEQILVMTYPHIGNTGVNIEDPESGQVWVSGFIAREFSSIVSNHRATSDLNTYLQDSNVPALHGIDTRALVRHLRDKGAMRGILTTEDKSIEELEALLSGYDSMEGKALASLATRKVEGIIHSSENPRLKVNLIDGGAKENIVRLLKSANCQINILSIDSNAEEWVSDCDLIFLSNGPGDPAALSPVIEQIQKCLGKKPMVGICLGHQLLALALGAKTFKLPFGHRGANHPVSDTQTGRVEISSQNHGFCVEAESLKASGAEVTHWNLNDNTVAGFVHRKQRAMGVQFHPEASPGPRDSEHLVIERYLEFAEQA
ncbi:MAG: glutamine-hydrolyzing carbamoyl-phosphate synthase small subunit [Myxococcota bacterium]